MIKKICVLFFSLITILLFPLTQIKVNAFTPNFAQIKNSSTYIYKSAELNESVSNKWCLVENTYFVKILNNFNDVFYKVEYNGIIGYVKKDHIMLVNEIPLNPYPNNITFNINNNSSCYLRSSPRIKETFNNTICSIDAGTKNLKYIGKIIGEEAIDFNGTIWYLTEYNGNLGYIYGAYTNSVNNIASNTEQITMFSGYDFSKVNPLTNPTCLFIIVITLIPCLIILFLIYLPRNKSIAHTKKNKQKTSNISFYDENL